MTFTPEVWDGAVCRLRSELPPYICDAFITNLVVEPDPKEEDGVRVICPTSFHRDRVRDQYRKQIGAALSAELGRRVAVDISVVRDGSSPPPMPREAAAREPLPAPVPTAPASAQPEPSRPHQRPAPRAPRRHALNGSGPGHPGERTSTTRHAGRPAAQRPLLRCNPTFASFVVGECNALAREASLAVLRDDDPRLDQLFLCAASGLGKTHLARAVVTEARAQGRRALYTSAESFTNEFLASLRSRKTAGFKRKFRQECDVLVVEDVAFLQGKESTQLEFFHTVQHVRDAGGRVVLTGTRLPQSLPDLDQRVRAQMSDGFVAEMAAPDAEVRRDILRSKAAAGGVHLPPECLEMLVGSIRGSVRDLESVLIQLVTTASLLKKRIDIALTREALDKKGAEASAALPRLQIADVLELVAGSFQTTVAEMSGKSRKKEVLVPRQMAMYLCRRYTDASLAEIGRALHRDHPAVRNAIQKIERAVLEKAPMRYQVEELARKLDSRG